MTTDDRQPGANEASTALRKLSRRLGIVDEYLDQSGTERRRTSDSTRIALLAALGVDASTGEAASAAFEAREREAMAELLAPVAVVGEDRAGSLEVRVARDERWRLRIRSEDGAERRLEGRGPATLDPGHLPPGYHDVEVEAGSTSATQRRIVTPQRCPSVGEVAGQDRAFGIVAQLYAVRSRSNWGVGDAGDIDRLVDCASRWGASFVGLNPLHALRNEGSAISPYSPVSRLFGNWLYIDLASVPEHDGAVPPDLDALRRSDCVDYERVASAKRAALRRAFERFLATASPERRADQERHRARGGDELERFATFSVLDAEARVRYPRFDAPGVDALRTERRRDIDFVCWLQFELDRQLGHSAKRARERGVSIGLYQDLAIGCAPDGSDVWSHPELFVSGAAIGAPPDSYSKDGQNWGLPPLHPERLRATAYRYWSTLLQRAFAHAGALRMDHVIGLFRQFWIPAGKSGKEGAYIAFPFEDLLGILALEATRARAVVVGEDLGTVPDNVPDVLARHGVLSSRVLYFEQADGEFLPSSSYPANALTTANTHDMAPLAGWLAARDIALRTSVGILDEKAGLEAQTARRNEIAALHRRLGGEHADADAARFASSVHGFLARTPSALVGVALDDITGEVDPVNVPGTTAEQHGNWQRRYSVDLEDLPGEPAALPADLRERGRAPRPG